MIETLKSLHSEWCRLTGQDIKYQPCERILFDLNAAGFTSDDLESVLTFMLWHNRKREPKYRDRILFHRICGDLETFNSRLGEAKAWARNRKRPPTPREAILTLTGRAPEPKANLRRVSEVFKGLGEQEPK